MQGVVEAVLLLLQLDFGSGADIDDGHATCQFGEALLQLLAVVAHCIKYYSAVFAGTPVAGGLLDLGFDLPHAGLDHLAVALAHVI